MNPSLYSSTLGKHLNKWCLEARWSDSYLVQSCCSKSRFRSHQYVSAQTIKCPSFRQETTAQDPEDLCLSGLGTLWTRQGRDMASSHASLCGLLDPAGSMGMRQPMILQSKPHSDTVVTEDVFPNTYIRPSQPVKRPSNSASWRNSDAVP